MSSSARIDELRKKFDENPRRFFAPLANEYRKAGDFEQAVFICQEYLPQQPGHMSGHIVYGQTLFDMGRDEEAKAVFETALTLDPENLIALKHLGDIARQAGDLEGARGWYQRVLEADPRNEEIMLVLESLGGADMGIGVVAPPRVVSSTESSFPIGFGEPPSPAFESTADALRDGAIVEASDDSEPAEMLVLEQSIDADLPVAESETIDFRVETHAPFDDEPSDEPASTDVASDEKTSDEMAFDKMMSDAVASDEVMSDVVASDEAPPEATSHELLDLVDFSFGAPDTASESPVEAESIAAAGPIDIEAFAAEPSVEDATPDAAPEPETELATDVILGLPDDSPESTSVPAIPDLEVEPTPVATEALTHAIDQLAGLESFSMDIPVETPPSESDEPEAPATPDTFATETMAELYAQQGHLDSALEIYEQLLERSPDDSELRRRAGEVERRLYGTPAVDVAAPVEDVVVAAVTVESIDSGPIAEPAAPVFAGPTIRAFFAELLTGRGAQEHEATAATPAGISESAADIAPLESEGSIDILFSDATTDDADLSAAMSLAQAFGGDEARDEGAALHGTPAHPATDELSLDHVFRSTTPVKGNASAGAFSLDQFFAGESGNDAPPGSNEGGPARSSDDIAQFNAWLNGLKKT